VDIYSDIDSVKRYAEFLKCGMVHLVMGELTVIVATEHFSVQESYSVVVNNKI
jgi:hypothetical protein